MQTDPPQAATPRDDGRQTPTAIARARRRFASASVNSGIILASDYAQDVGPLLAELDRVTAELSAATELLRECDRTLMEHHNAKWHEPNAPMFDRAGSCKVCGDYPNNVFARLEQFFRRQKEASRGN